MRQLFTNVFVVFLLQQILAPADDYGHQEWITDESDTAPPAEICRVEQGRKLATPIGEEMQAPQEDLIEYAD